MEAGHAAQNVCLQAVSLDLGTVVIGAFDDDDIKKVMQLTATEEPLYIIPVGKRRR
jgi:nitroreductase